MFLSDAWTKAKDAERSGGRNLGRAQPDRVAAPSLDMGAAPIYPCSCSMRAKTPHWSLDRVKTLVAEGKVFIQRSRALVFFRDRGAATEAVQQVVSALALRSFAETKTQTYDTCDVYGVRWEGAGWYLKICVDETMPEVAIVSFHPLAHPLRTNGGMVSPKPAK